MSIGVAIIGGGIFVREEHLPAVQAASSHLTLKAIYSRSIKSAKALEANVDLYSDDSGSGNTYYDLLLRDDIQAVILALPIPAQPEYVEAALAAGKHVLSEKPIAKDITSAQKLIDYYKSDKVKGGATWGVAENFRFLDSFLFARQEVQKLGRVLGFRVKMFGNVQPGSKYFGEEATPTALTAFTTLLQEHLPPVDTVNSVWQTKTGISGTFSVSFGTTLSGSEYVIACEKGSVAVEFSKVTVRLGMEKDKKETVKEFKEEGAGVKQEVAAWAKSLSEGTPNPGQAPEQALADLEILEKMLKSGENQGAAQSLKYQL
ncbi:hypothetical protein M7I_3706 [Glarea lozoyensis 74030]|uniref:Gfo/Idh/MocA-like oxidoreductase N-terminal domain-containing protein n=1 Tax=Glarea lozoyensis (strain ATCC 74030 / MF5533) TaxID=1104152 RepID=H0EM76_GLAL7|nr:hypothetical protein M7I_3706 [Glarea lozoyensis 74030]